MADSVNDGGPAFPIEWWPESAAAHSGMTLRDYFAAQVSTSLMGTRVTEGSVYVDYAASATAAYAMADAMLKERNKIGGAS